MKKFIKFFVVLLLALAIGFVAIGFITPKVTYDSEITVAKPANEAWAVMNDVEKLPDWLTGFKKFEHVSGTKGQVGAVSNVYFDNNGETMIIKETITKIIPNKSISMVYESDFMDMHYTITFNSLPNNQTKISSTTMAEGNGMISKSIMAIISSTLKAQEETNLTKLKTTIENNTKQYF
ncbi:SRPBCC family protein [Myroides sp. JBRI-B21084]|uniref:SRPBCC family protein n=1 Tax=Myroides sp. JBRI-B21084 TaxID=3119977 RepID=UPI0026E42A9A|nr:SRPBCC family protein [Paenimyroides cloacae]WKW46487.1 SRPBCC family protein [Paenimyroides cloacae]